MRIELTTLGVLATELLEALWRAGLKFDYNHTSHRGMYADQKGAQGQYSNFPLCNRYQPRLSVRFQITLKVSGKCQTEVA